jgi:hypothetical protein
MKRKYLAILLSLSLVSCQFFETEKISSETFYEEELKAINWEDVDQYPAFSACEEFTEKKEQKHCFETTLSQYVYQTIESKNIVTGQDINSTVLLAFNISNTGEISNLNIEMDTVIEKEIPFLRQWLVECIDSLPQAAPAYKRGIPVNTKFTLPLVIKSKIATN